MPSTNKTTDFTGQTFYVGLDVHKKSWAVTVRTLEFEVAHFSQPPGVDQLSRHLNNRYPGGRFISAYEAGFCGTSIHEQLCKAGIKNIVIHPADLPQTDKQKKNKTDVHDSRAAARYLEAGVLKGIYIMAVDQQQRRALFRLRQTKKKDVTRCTNRLRSFLYFHGIDQVPPENKYLSKRILNQLSQTSSSLTQEGALSLQHYIDELFYHRRQLTVITKQLKQSMLAADADGYNSLISIPGIGSITSLGLLAEIADFNRFADHDQYCSYLGLAPSERSSGEKVYSIGMQSRCNTHLRPLLIEASWQAIRRSPRILHYYKKHAAKDSNKAIVKVAAKLALIARAVVIKKTTYIE